VIRLGSDFSVATSAKTKYRRLPPFTSPGWLTRSQLVISLFDVLSVSPLQTVLGGDISTQVRLSDNERV
jgi:hypothetical protein